MNIISTTFFISFIIFFAIYWLLSKHLKLQNFILLVANYAFYSCLDWKFSILLLSISLTAYFSSLSFEKIKEQTKKKVILIANIIINIGILFIFKYYDFFAVEFAKLIGVNPDKVLLNLILPIGISFYTFTTTGYIIDVYKGTTKVTKEIVPFLNFILFFPLIMSGPIERSTGLLPQLKQIRKFDYSLAVDGTIQIMWGIFKKSVIADNCAMVVNNAFGNYANLPASSLLAGAILYTIQIYFDFSGYSDIAIGLSKLLGFRVRRNFHYPYFALNVSDFWRRWHMSLQSWFTDYIYFPLGGSRCSKARTIFNTFVVFTVCGIWHGANWTFVVWGIYHALLFVPLILFCSKEFRKTTVNEDSILPSLKEFSFMLLIFVLVTIGWIMFNANSITDALGYIKGIFDYSIISAPTGIGLKDCFYVLLLIVIVFILEWKYRAKEYALQFNSPGWVKIFILYAIIVHLIFCNATQSDFIYYQF